ncbi:hypothetical protein [Shewanella hanedai]|uniref:Uncharacterized protein n=1 Tax=Shewanella hanedai TaxID=25 RepID=A0A553JLH4_SHEHA|nr:hypothetical protein [Shewanella hanedai]TRY13291.1 hypothetical protein FN961_16730 [Shewanella hanedai]
MSDNKFTDLPDSKFQISFWIGSLGWIGIWLLLDKHRFIAVYCLQQVPCRDAPMSQWQDAKERPDVQILQ